MILNEIIHSYLTLAYAFGAHGNICKISHEVMISEIISKNFQDPSKASSAAATVMKQDLGPASPSSQQDQGLTRMPSLQQQSSWSEGKKNMKWIFFRELKFVLLSYPIPIWMLPIKLFWTSTVLK